jgi:hypothetical protein
MNSYINKLMMLMSVLLVSMTIHAQDDRQNASLPVIGEKVLWSLTEATGWIKNNEGQWLEGKNIIYEKHLSAANKSVLSEGKNILGKDNFIKFEVRDINIAGKDFFIITKVLTESAYDYPSTHLGWKARKMVYYFVFQKGKAKSKVNDYDPKALTYSSNGYFVGLIGYDADYLNKIALDIAEVDRSDPAFRKNGINTNFQIEYKLLSDGKACRFQIMPHTFQPSERVEYIHDHASIFQDYYFECPKEKLDRLLQLISSK